jgi:dienelactone hydrolase
MGGRVPATLIMPLNTGPFAPGEDAMAGIVVQHGSSCGRSSTYGLASRLARSGAAVITIDAPFCRPGAEDIYDMASWRAERDRRYQIQLIVDLRRAVDVLVSQPEVDPQRLAYIGLSYGAAMGGLMAGVEDRLATLVLIVGDGGLNEHTSDPDEQGYPDHWHQAWVDAMWPIEPLHFVGRATAPILFMNGTQDVNVPPRDALRYYQAASEPKEQWWYDAAHYLPARAYGQDTMAWLQDQIGVGTLLLRPSFATTSLLLDRLLVGWFVLAALSVAVLLWDLGRRQVAPGSWLAWMAAVLVFGILGLVAYLAARLQRGRGAMPTWKQALGSTAWAVTGNLIGAVVAIQILLNLPPMAPAFQAAMVYLLPLVSGWLFFQAVRLISWRDEEFRARYQRSALAEFVSVHVVMAGAWTVTIGLLNWLGPAVFGLDSARFWAIMVLSGGAGALLAYPVHVWLVRRGLAGWGRAPASPAAEHPRSSPEWFARLVAVVLSLALLASANLVLLML